MEAEILSTWRTDYHYCRTYLTWLIILLKNRARRLLVSNTSTFNNEKLVTRPGDSNTPPSPTLQHQHRHQGYHNNIYSTITKPSTVHNETNTATPAIAAAVTTLPSSTRFPSDATPQRCQHNEHSRQLQSTTSRPGLLECTFGYAWSTRKGFQRTSTWRNCARISETSNKPAGFASSPM